MFFHSISAVSAAFAQAAPGRGPLLSWLDSSLMMFVAFLVVVIGSFLIAKSFSKSIRMPEQSTRLFIIFLSASLSCLLIATKWPPKFGVDLRGGMNIIGQLKLDEFKDTNSIMGGPSTVAADIIGTLSQRINPGGVNEIVIRALGVDKIEVIIPEVDEAAADEIWNRLVKTGHLQFRIVANPVRHAKEIAKAQELAAKGDTTRNIVDARPDGSRVTTARWYNLAREDAIGAITPSTILSIKDFPSPGSLIRDRQTGLLIDMSKVPLRSGDPGLDFARWLASEKIRTPQILMVEPIESMNVEGKHLTSIGTDIDEKGKPCVSFNLNSEGGSRLFKLTKTYEPTADGTQYQLGIVLDDQLHSSPVIEEPIHSSGRIRGRFTEKEVRDLVINLQSGKIDVALNKTPISRQFIQSTLGEELKLKGLLAITISFLTIVVFMFVYYQWFAGTAANVALLFNLILILAAVMAINQPLTLTGLAALVLTIGMAVDANVLIYERIREELQKGASLRAAFRTGFERATITIIDSNLTSVLSAVILYAIGTEQLKGFAVTLILGIMMSMFTTVFCSWTYFYIAERKSWVTKLRMMQIFPFGTIDFLSMQRACFSISGAMIVVGLIGLAMLGNRVLDIDLRGGSTAQIVLNEEISLKDLRSELDKKDYEFNGEKVTFYATEINDLANPGKAFKIDSNVPSPNPILNQNWKPLDTTLEEIFKGKLVLHHVKFDPSTITTVSVDSPANSISPSISPSKSDEKKSDEKKSDDKKLPDGVGKINRLPNQASFGPASLIAMAVTFPAQEPEKAQEEAKSAPPKTEEVAPVKTAETPPPTAPSVGDAIQVTPGAASGSVPSTAGRYKSTVELTFDSKITGKSIQTMLVEQSARLDKPVEQDQFSFSSPEIGSEDSVLATPAKVWRVTMETRNPDDCKAIIEAWASEFVTRPYFPTNSDVGGQVAQIAQYQALAALIASCIGMIIYIWIRFQNVAFGVAAVLALVHDVLITLGFIAWTHYLADYLGFFMIDKFKINLSIIAALLTIIGYSVNDTIVIFDRIREVRGKRIELTREMINVSVSQTLGRTILTSLTVFMVVIILYLFGGESIHGFAFAMCVGVFTGSYSTIYVASPILLWLVNKMGLNSALHEQQAVTQSKA